MKMPASLWVIVIIFSIFMLIHTTSALVYVYKMYEFGTSIDVWSSYDGVSLIIELTLSQLVLPILEILTIVLVFMRKKIGVMLLKISWSIITLMSLIIAFKDINKTLEYNEFSSMTEKFGWFIGALLLPIIMISLTYVLFKSPKIKNYFQSVQVKQ